MAYGEARRTEGRTGGFGVARTEVGSGREKRETERKRERGNLWQRVDRKRSAEKCTTSAALVWQLCGRTTASACVRKRERERRRGRGRDGEKGREKGTDGSGREIDVYPPTNTDARGGGREESQAESRWARSGLPEFHTHRALLRVPSRRGEPHEGGGATPSRKRGQPRTFRFLRVGSPKALEIF